MAFSKPNVNTLWASTGAKVEPTLAKKQQGWVSEIPPFEFENWIQNRQDQFNAHVNQYGIAVWDSSTEYQAKKSYVQGSDGIVYKAVQTHSNQNPVLDATATYWSVAFTISGFSYSKAESDNLFLKRTNNLSDLSSSASARSNLSVYSKNDVYTKNEVNALLDPVGKVIMFAGAAEPQGYLTCDGRVISRSTYSDLFNTIGTAFGAGDGSTTFNIPDLRNEFVRGASSTRNVGTKESDQFKEHRHSGTTSTAGEHAHGGVPQRRSDTDRGTGGSSLFSVDNTGSTSNAGSHNHTFNTTLVGGSETRPRNVALQFCIKY